MTFAGLESEKQRADVVAYLNSNSDNPLQLPKAAAQAQPTSPSKAPASSDPNPPAPATTPPAK
jgi:cytochrome c